MLSELLLISSTNIIRRTAAHGVEIVYSVFLNGSQSFFKELVILILSVVTFLLSRVSKF